MSKHVTVTLRSGEQVEFFAESVEMKDRVLTWSSLEDGSRPTLIALDQDAVVAVVAVDVADSTDDD